MHIVVTAKGIILRIKNKNYAKVLFCVTYNSELCVEIKKKVTFSLCTCSEFTNFPSIFYEFVREKLSLLSFQDITV